jgi:hypothetical protein
MNLRCPACGLVISGGGHGHVCPGDLAETIASELMDSLKSGSIDKIDIHTIRLACFNVEPLVDKVLRLVITKVG